MFKILSIIVLGWFAYRLFFKEPKQIEEGPLHVQEKDEFIDYEEIEDEK